MLKCKSNLKLGEAEGLQWHDVRFRYLVHAAFVVTGIGQGALHRTGPYALELDSVIATV